MFGYTVDMSEITKLALEQSLKKVLLEKPLDKIKISDITDGCGVSRMTFYYHFKDIYDLIEWSCQHDASIAIGRNKTYATWQEGFLNLFDEVKKNKPFILNVYHCEDMRHILRYLNQVTDDLLYSVVEEAAKDMHVSEEDKMFVAGFYSHAFVGLMTDWIDGGMKEDPAKIIEKLTLTIHGNVPKALKALEQAHPHK